MARTQLIRGSEAKADITIFRKGGERISADENFELQPGDVVEVSLRALNSPLLAPIDATVLGTTTSADRACHSACNFDPPSRGIGVQN